MDQDDLFSMRVGTSDDETACAHAVPGASLDVRVEDSD